MKLQQTIKQIILEDINNKSYKIEKLLSRMVKEKYPRFVCRIEVIPPGNESFYVSGQKTKNYIVRVVFKPLPDGGWVARDYEEKVMNECWDMVYGFTGIPVDVYSKHDPTCGRDSMIGISESRFLKRRVGPELIEDGIKDALDYVSGKFYNKRSGFSI